jgi:hypothetical protein
MQTFLLTGGLQQVELVVVKETVATTTIDHLLVALVAVVAVVVVLFRQTTQSSVGQRVLVVALWLPGTHRQFKDN